MSVFRFRLQRLLDQRVRVREEALKNLAARRTELRREEGTLMQIQRHIHKLEQQILSARKAALDSETVAAHTLIHRSDCLRGLANDADTAHDSLAATKLAVDNARARMEQELDHLSVCLREEEMLTKFKDKLRQRFLKSEARKEDIEQDEIGNILYLARSSTQ